MSEIGAAVIQDTTARYVSRQRVLAMDRQTAAINKQTNVVASLSRLIADLTQRVAALEAGEDQS